MRDNCNSASSNPMYTCMYSMCNTYFVYAQAGRFGRTIKVHVRLDTSTCRYPAQYYIESTCASQKATQHLI